MRVAYVVAVAALAGLTVSARAEVSSAEIKAFAKQQLQTLYRVYQATEVCAERFALYSRLDLKALGNGSKQMASYLTKKETQVLWESSGDLAAGLRSMTNDDAYRACKVMEPSTRRLFSQSTKPGKNPLD